ncbi:major facilitator superfamily domain-containing protein [Radiomyces spectabilis]|uniref:major facilitator superfamily domain-containing protein n=1 Tax=Radiomyces spectabilis TaxID=64574 RepID=UPI00221F5790|nr:major facilitator superfamily domain-containing protein [Radiomyces spectabilis]KAI8393540.1 major facilitator superfamily domain-containing protein [Radiomyces spectabilis]
MQDYYDQHVFTDIPDAQFQLSWAGTLMEVFVNLMSPLAQVLASIFGFRVVLIAGTILASLGLELAGFSTKIWHLYLTQGVLFGAGASFLWVIAMGITPQWFNRRRGLALGLAASGGGIGGLVFPFFLTPLNNTLGVGWTYRILGFVCLVCDVITCIVIKEKFPAKKRMKKLSAILSLDVLKNSTFVIWIIGSVISLAGYFVPYFFVPSYASYIGLTPSQSSVLIAVMSAANFTGRVVVGQIGDMIGRLNADIIFTFICGLSNLLIWNFAYSYGVLMAFSVIFGLTCGSYFALMSPITATILGMEKYPTGLSVLMLFSILAVFGPSISSAIETHVNAEPYFTYKMFAGLAYVIGGVILVILKMKMCKNKIFAKI